MQTLKAASLNRCNTDGRPEKATWNANMCRLLYWNDDRQHRNSNSKSTI